VRRIKNQTNFTDSGKYFEEINEDPIVYRWGWNLDDIDPSEEVQVDALFKNV